MPILLITILPKQLMAVLKRPGQGVPVSPYLLDASRDDAETVLQRLGASRSGLSQEEAESRLEKYGPNVIVQEKRQAWTKLLFKAAVNPLVILMLLLAAVSFVTGETRAAAVMSAMALLGVVLRFVPERRADRAAARLKAMISVTATVVRDGKSREAPIESLVPGDIVRLSAGDMIPADVRVVSCKDLFVIQASLTGESFPVEKSDARLGDTAVSLPEMSNLCLLGTSVESGSAVAVVLATGLKTYFGRMASAIAAQPVQTSFDKGMTRFTWLMIRFMLVLTPLVFLINGFTKGNWQEAFFFALAVAVGLTPEMLPMIVTVCLSKGAMSMSKKKVIVKRINSIQNLGAMDVLCTDKTGTLTLDRIIIERHCDVVRGDDDSVLEMAYLNSFFQTGLKNLLDRAVLEHGEEVHGEISAARHRKVDEIPFDFSRRLMSVVVETPEGTHRIISKGAPEEVFRRCARFELHGRIYPLSRMLVVDLKEEYDELSGQGFRVLGLAYKDVEKKPGYSKDDEDGLVLKGYVAFLDPPKDTAAPAIVGLQKHGLSVKVLTGDNELVSRKICQEVGIPTDHVLTGTQLETMSDAQLAAAAEKTTLFARLSPTDKQRVIRALQSRGHVVGFLGDGMNDAPALRAADVGISVDSAVDIAKESADVILLEKSLLVIEEGVLEGRKVFANILKYVRMGASSSFGNMFSVVGASIFLPFMPMAPIQILTSNLLYDFSQVPIPTDDVDPEQIVKPRPWSMGQITRFILFIGPCSSVFDYTTYFLMMFVFGCRDLAHAPLFQTGWFVESLLTQTLIIHVIRTNRVPFLQSRASWPLIVTTTLIMIAGIWLPFSFIAAPLGFSSLPRLYWPFLIATLLCYVALTQAVKMWLIRKAWI